MARTATLIDHLLKNSSHKVSKSQLIDLGLTGHDLIFCTRKTQKPNSHEHNNQILDQSLKHAIENFKDVLKKIHFQNYLK